MQIILKLLFLSLILSGGILLGDVVYAGEQQAGPGEISDIAEFGEPVPNDTLNALSGGQSLQIDNIDMLMNNMNIKSDLAENVLYSATTGANTLSNGAFSSASGISTVIQNSGNQVVINSALILNLQVQ